MPSQLAPVTPDVLKWARESINVSVAEAAKRAASLDEQLATLAPDSKEAREIVSRYDNCTELGDALYLPAPDQL